MKSDNLSSINKRKRVFFRCSMATSSYDNEAPINVGATQAPLAVRILWTFFVTGLTHAASFVSRVVKPIFPCKF